MSAIRQQRVAELLFQELSILIGSELADPRLSLVRVMNVNVSRDLRNVNVYVSHDDGELSKKEVLQGLRHATPFLRRQLAIRCSLRAVPELSFHYDDTPEKAARVDELLRQIAATRPVTSTESGAVTGTVTNTDSATGATSVNGTESNTANNSGANKPATPPAQQASQ